MSRRFAESVDRLLGIFQAIAERANPKTGYSPRLPGEEVKALVAFLAGHGDVMRAGVLEREYDRLVRSLAGAGAFSGRPPTLTLAERQQGVQTAVARIVRLLEQVKLDASPKRPPADDRPQGDGKPAAEQARGKGKKATVAARMIDLVRKPATHTWTAREFATRLSCSPGAVVATAAWKELMVAREMARQKRSAKAYRRNLSRKPDRRRKAKHSSTWDKGVRS